MDGANCKCSDVNPNDLLKVIPENYLDFQSVSHTTGQRIILKSIKPFSDGDIYGNPNPIIQSHPNDENLTFGNGLIQTISHGVNRYDKYDYSPKNIIKYGPEIKNFGYYNQLAEFRRQEYESEQERILLPDLYYGYKYYGE